MAIPASVVAGLLAGLVLGLLGAGGTVVGLPVLLYLGSLSPHSALGTNAMGVAGIALALLGRRMLRREVRLAPGVIFAVPGLAGIVLGTRLGLLYPGQKLVFLLGILLFVVAAWFAFLSARHDERSPADGGAGMPPIAGGSSRSVATRLDRRRAIWLVPVALAVGAAAGFFAVGGGFMIVPGLALVGGLELQEAAMVSLLPIAAFAGLDGIQYLSAGRVDLPLSGLMLLVGLVGGLVGIKLGARLPKRVLQGIFAAFLALLGVYIVLH